MSGVSNSQTAYWHGKEPVVEFPRIEIPWKPYNYDPLSFAHYSTFSRPDPRSLFFYNDPKAKYAWWDGSCLCRELMLEGPKSIVKWEPKPSTE